MHPIEILNALRSQTPMRTADLPTDERGIYGLIDHEGYLRYIGSTSVPAENFRKRIHQRHRTGSETHSHYFSKVYNCGRMWRDRFDYSALEDAKIAKALRSDFIAEYCRAVFVSLIGTKAEIECLEAGVIAITPPENRWWNGRTDIVYEEPTALLDQLLERRGCDESRHAAIKRQAVRARERAFRRTN